MNDTECEYVNWLLDDDLFAPRKIELMIEAIRNNPDCSLVTSLRYTMDGKGKVTGNFGSIANKNSKHKGEDIIKLFFHTYHNFVGEPTTVLINKKFLRNGDMCWSEDEPGFFSIVDVSTWCQLLSKGNLYWIVEPLSVYRRYNDEDGANNGFSMKAMLDQVIGHAKCIKRLYEEKIALKTEYDLKLAIVVWLRIAAEFLRQSFTTNYDDEERNILLEKMINSMSQALISGSIENWPYEEYKKLFVDDVLENLKKVED